MLPRPITKDGTESSHTEPTPGLQPAPSSARTRAHRLREVEDGRFRQAGAYEIRMLARMRLGRALTRCPEAVRGSQLHGAPRDDANRGPGTADDVNETGRNRNERVHTPRMQG